MLVPLLVAALAFAPAAKPPKSKQAPKPAAPAAVAANLPADLAAYIHGEQQDRTLPSISAVVVDVGGKMSFAGSGFADATQRTPDPDTMYRVASVTRLFTGVALMILRDHGDLALDDPLAKLVPEILQVKGGDKITLRQVLTDKSGLPRDPPVASDARIGITEAQLLSSLAKTSLAFAPGAQVQFSNYAVALLATAIARTSKVPYRAFVQARVLDPLDVRCVWSRDDVAIEAGGNGDWAESYTDPQMTVPTPHNTLGAMEASGGLYCSARDLAKFALWFLQADGDGDVRVLSRGSRKEMWDAPVGWFLENNQKLGRLPGQKGLVNNYTAALYVDRDRKRAVALLIAGAASDVAGGVAHNVLRLAAGQVRPEELRSPPRPQDPASSTAPTTSSAP